MNTTQLRAAEAGLCFLFIFLSGFWLSRYERPYPGIFFNIHKLIGLATLVFLGVTIYRLHQASPLSPVEILALAISTLLFVCTIIVGGLLNIEMPLSTVLGTVHKGIPYLTTLSCAVTLYLLFRHTWN